MYRAGTQLRQPRHRRSRHLRRRHRALDLKARLLGTAVTALLGSARPVPIYGSGGSTTYDSRQQSDQLSNWVEDLQIPRVKIKIGESWGQSEDRDLSRIALARALIGQQAELYVGANGGYTAAQAAIVAARMTEHPRHLVRGTCVQR